MHTRQPGITKKTTLIAKYTKMLYRLGTCANMEHEHESDARWESPEPKRAINERQKSRENGRDKKTA